MMQRGTNEARPAREANGAAAQLRAATRAEHASIEGTSLARAMMDGSFTRAEHRTQLEVYLRVHVALEGALLRAEDPRVRVVVPPDMHKSGLLASDLRCVSDAPFLTSEALDAEIAALERRATEAVGSAAALLGQVYVLEGSTLGGLVLLPRLRAALALSDDELRYYAPYGADTMKHWHAFSGRLSAALADADAIDRAALAARATFAGLARAFDAIALTSRGGGPA